MNKLVSTFIISSFTAAMGVSVFAADDGGALYLDAGRPVEQRVKDLMSRMTLGRCVNGSAWSICEPLHRI